MKVLCDIEDAGGVHRRLTYRHSAVCLNVGSGSGDQLSMAEVRSATVAQLRVNVLGHLMLADEEHDLTPSAPKLRTVLAMLGIRGGRVVSSAALVEELWAEEPPLSATTTLQTYIYQLRRALRTAGCGDLLQTMASGYRLVLPPDALDADRFDQLCDSARQDHRAGRLVEAVDRLSAADRLWRGGVLDDVECGARLSTFRRRMEETRLQAHELRIDICRQLGRDQQVITELHELTIAHPLHEAFTAQLMRALCRTGRRSAALLAYTRQRSVLIDELGVEPCESLRSLHQAALAADPALESPARPGPAGQPEWPRARQPLLPSPAQLPPDISDFAGRGRLVERLSGMVGLPGRPGGGLAVVTGREGVGKGALVLRVAHRVREAYQDGQLYAVLRGPDGVPVPPEEVLDGFLRSLGMAPAQIPSTVEERTSLFRSCTAQLSVLVVLERADSFEQVRPLLSGGSHCTTIVTSTRSMATLPAARLVRLEPMAHEEGLQVIQGVAGRTRRDVDHVNTAALVRLCDGIPLTLRAAAVMIADRPHQKIDEVVAELAAERRRLGMLLRYEGQDMIARLGAINRMLSSSQRRALRLLSDGGKSCFRLEHAAAVLGGDSLAAGDMIGQLVNANLVEAHLDPDGAAGYRIPDLVRLCTSGESSAYRNLPTGKVRGSRVSRHRRRLATGHRVNRYST